MSVLKEAFHFNTHQQRKPTDMSVFDPESYLTPDAVIAKMIEPYADILSTTTSSSAWIKTKD